MRSIVRMAVATAAIGMAANATPANASLLLDTSTFTVTADHDAGPNQVTINFDSPVSGLTSALVLTLTGGTGNSFDFTYNFTEVGDANLVGFGFDTNPNLASVTNATGPLQFFSNTTFPGSGNIEACFNGGANCSSASGQAGSFSGGFTLNFSGSGPFTLNDFVDRYASIAALNNQSGEGHPFVPAVPEPATWATMLLGFSGIGMAMRRRRKDGRFLQIA
jgi:PEP-CTERM motif-containing protein